MATSRYAFVALLGVALAACGAEGASLNPGTPPSGVAQVSQAPVTTNPVVTPEPEPSTLAPIPKPTPVPIPVPPKPTGLQLEAACGWDADGGGGCDTGTDGASHLTWKRPRTKGVEIRVYGVTTCFRADATDGPCLRKNTTLPDDLRVLLAKGPASKGELSFHRSLFYETNDGCTFGYLSGNGTPFYSIVVAAYNASGHSIFAIADAGRFKAGECGVETD